MVCDWIAVDVTGSDCHYVRMEWDLRQHDLGAIAGVVRELRTALGWSKEEAARRAGISSITWKRVEDALVVQDAKLAQVFRALNINSIEDGFDRIALTEDEVAVRRRPATAEESYRSVMHERATQDQPLEARIAATIRRISELRVALASAEGELEELERQLEEQVGRMYPWTRPGPLSEPADTPDLAIAADEQESSIAGEQEESETP